MRTLKEVEKSYFELKEKMESVCHMIEKLNDENPASSSDLISLMKYRDTISEMNNECKQLLMIVSEDPRMLYNVAAEHNIAFIGNAVEDFYKAINLTDAFIAAMNTSIISLSKKPKQECAS